MKLACILLNWRTPDMTLKALDSLIEATKNLDAQILIVDNDSQDGSEEKLRAAVEELKSERIEVLQSGNNGGFGAGNNTGIRHALASDDPPEFIHLLNSDAFPAVDAIEKLLAVQEADPSVGITGSYIHGTDGTPHVTAFRFPSLLSELEGGIRLGVVSRLLKDYIVPIGIPESNRPVDWLAGASMMMRVSMLDEVGLFDETFFLYFEETDLCRRAANKGWTTMYVRDSDVAHIGSASTGMKEWTRVPSYWFDSRKHYFEKNHGLVYEMAATSLNVGTGVLWQLRRRLQSKPDEDAPGFLIDMVKHRLAAFNASFSASFRK